MRIFLTGGSGMVGRNIREHPHSRKHQIQFPSSAELDLLDRDAVYKALAIEMPDMVIHAAGRVGGIQANISNPLRFLQDNLGMGVNVITAAHSLGIPNLINLSSSCVYPKDALNPLTEDMILKGALEPTNEGYALAKIVNTRLCEFISRENLDKNYKTVIPCNLYGPYDKYDPSHSHMIPAVIRKLHEAKQNELEVVDIWGNVKARREFMSARDLAGFIYYAIDHFQSMPQNLNVGLGLDYSIKEYYQAVASVVGYTGKLRYDLTKPVGMKQKLMDDSELTNFGWQPKIALREGLVDAYQFYKDENLK